MDQPRREITRKIIFRLIISGILFVASMSLSAVTFYYYYLKAPLIPLAVGLTGWLPAAMMLMSWHDLRLLKLKEAQPAQEPPQRSHDQKRKR
jgi:hypothetical protein